MYSLLECPVPHFRSNACTLSVFVVQTSDATPPPPENMLLLEIIMFLCPRNIHVQADEEILLPALLSFHIKMTCIIYSFSALKFSSASPISFSATAM